MNRLEVELRKAYTRKALQAQLVEKELKKQLEKINTKDEEAVLFEDLGRGDNIDSNRAYGKELYEEVLKKRKDKESRDKELRDERKMLFEIDRVRSEIDEGVRFKDKFNAIDLARRQLRISQQMKLVEKSKEFEREAEARFEILRHRERLSIRWKTFDRSKMRDLKKREELLTRVADIVLSADRERETRCDLYVRLIAEDVGLERTTEDEGSTRKTNLAKDLKEQMRLEEERRMRWLSDDRKFAADLEKIILDDRRILGLTESAKVRRKFLYRRELDKLVELRGVLRERELNRNDPQNIHEFQIGDESYSNDDRLSLLKEHVPGIGRFLTTSRLTPEESRIVEFYRNEN